MMIPSEEFLRHAAECKRMAKSIGDPKDRALWVRMAERWNRCAELASCHDPALQQRKAKPCLEPAHKFGALSSIKRPSPTSSPLSFPRRVEMIASSAAVGHSRSASGGRRR